ncbi:hypothetical protein H2200_007364 [Cladophialophora chaetospira]|uniref:Uncharacterized protein n=1 Tax=Cladophialophora chaetospira TaxID=386627 RepID=A0AA38X7S5_9EURO|nr:hypothetical protein H2200_007364 [Cladophialophora chaetospira]
MRLASVATGAFVATTVLGAPAQQGTSTLATEVVATTVVTPSTTASAKVSGQPEAFSKGGPFPSSFTGKPEWAQGRPKTNSTGNAPFRPNGRFGHDHGHRHGNGSHSHGPAGSPYRHAAPTNGDHRHGYGGPYLNATATAAPTASGKPYGIVARNSGTGSAVVANECPFVVYTNIVHAPRPGQAGAPEEILVTLQTGESQSHPFDHDLNMGVSWKVWRTDTNNKNVVQFEYTYVGERTYYDLSMINGGTVEYLEPEEHEGETIEEGANNDGSGKLTGEVGVVHPFAEEGLSLIAQGNVGGGCGSVVCPAGDRTCAQAYNTDDDHQAMRDCGASVDLKLTLCG